MSIGCCAKHGASVLVVCPIAISKNSLDFSCIAVPRLFVEIFSFFSIKNFGVLLEKSAFRELFRT